MDITYHLNKKINLRQFTDLLQRSTLSERRPMNDPACLQGMLDNTNLSYTAWQGDELIGIARCVTDFHYCCYLSDLAVDQSVQQSGIGKTLITLCQNQLKPNCKLVLLASPDAHSYYQHIGMQAHERCWVLQTDNLLS